jgi:hypothetical protein
MAERRINLNNYKSSGVYTVEIDESANVALPLTSGRLVVGSSRVGPFNTIVLVNDLRTLKAVYGEIDPKLEKAGGFFHRSIEVALREGPVFALNVMPLDTEADNTLNLDQAYFTTFNTESSANNEDGNPIQNKIIDFFNKQRLWFADAEQLNRTKNLSLGDDFVTNPGGLGMVSIASNKILSFVNTGKTNSTVWVRKAETTGFDVTAKEWYNTVGGGKDIEFPSFVHPDDFISDYMVETMIVTGDWTNYLKLSKDPIYKQFFDASGLIQGKSADFFALREIKVISRVIGCLIPNFIDQSGNSISIDRLVNRLFPTTGIMAALDVDKLDLVDLGNDTFNDMEVDTHRVDIVGHGYDELAFTADDGGFDSNGTTAVAATPLIDTISYCQPSDDILVFNIPTGNSIAQATFDATTGVALGETFNINDATNEYLIAMDDSKLYEAYLKGFIRNGDVISDAGNDYYIKIDDELIITVGANDLKYIKLYVYSDISLLNATDVNYYAGTSGGDYIKITPTSGDNFKRTFDLTDTAYFSDYSVTQPNVLTIGVNTTPAQKAITDEFIKVNHYIKARTTTTGTRSRLLKIISVTSTVDLTSPGRTEYVVTTMAPSVDEVIGIDATGNEIQVYKGIDNYVTEIRGQYLKGFKVREALLPNKTAARQSDILSYLFDYTSIPQALAGKEVIDFRYVVDTYEGEISSSSKYYLSKICALHGQSMALLNAPSIKQFEQSVDPSFIDTTNKLLAARHIATGGDLGLNPSFTFKFAEEDVNGVPLASYSMFNFPNLIVRNGNRNISVPPAAYISNLYVRKFKNGQPFLIVAGGKRGVITDPELVGVEYELTDEDRDYLEPIGHNLIVKRRGFGTLLFSNNTAYQRINSALNNAHVRDNLSTIERDLARILFNFLFDFNDEITRLRVRTIVENYLDAVVNARGLSGYTVTFDSSNNGAEVLENNAAIIDVEVDFPRGIHKFINRITITRVGGGLSSESTGFTPSF